MLLIKKRISSPRIQLDLTYTYTISLLNHYTDTPRSPHDVIHTLKRHWTITTSPHNNRLTKHESTIVSATQRNTPNFRKMWVDISSKQRSGSAGEQVRLQRAILSFSNHTNALLLSSKTHRSIRVHTNVLMRFRLSKRSKTIKLHVVT